MAISTHRRRKGLQYGSRGTGNADALLAEAQLSNTPCRDFLFFRLTLESEDLLTKVK